MTPLLANWYIGRGLAADKAALGLSVDPALLEQPARDAVREHVDAGEAVTEYVAKLPVHRAVAAVTTEAVRTAAGKCVGSRQLGRRASG